MRSKEIEINKQSLLVYDDGTIYGIGRGKEIKTRINSDGYVQITVGFNKNRGRKSVHKIVAECFVEGYKKGYQVNHKDGDKTNNHFLNLEWVSQQDNLRHAFTSGLRKSNMPAKPIQAINDEGFGYWFFSQGQATKYGFTQANISKVLRGERPHHKGFHWTFI